MLDLLVDGGLVVVGAHGKPGDLSHQGVVGDTAHDGSSGSLGAARAEKGQVLTTAHEKRRKHVKNESK